MTWLLISQFAFDLFVIGFLGYFTKADIGILIIFFYLSFMKNMFLADSIFKWIKTLICEKQNFLILYLYKEKELKLNDIQ